MIGSTPREVGRGSKWLWAVALYEQARAVVLRPRPWGRIPLVAMITLLATAPVCLLLREVPARGTRRRQVVALHRRALRTTRRLTPWGRLPWLAMGALLATAPICLFLAQDRLGSRVLGRGEDEVALMVDHWQQTAAVAVIVLAVGRMWRLAPVLGALCLSSLSGLLIAAEIALVYWIVYGGLAGVGMPGLFWHFDATTRGWAAFGVTLFTGWMVYLLFTRDHEIHRHEPEHQIWPRFATAARASGLPIPRSMRGTPDGGPAGMLGRSNAAGRLSWFMAVFGVPATLALAIPALIPVARPLVPESVVDEPWLIGIAAGAATLGALATIRPATRLHELWHALKRWARREDPAWWTVWRLDRDRLDAHANMRNLFLVLSAVFLIPYWVAGPDVLRSRFPAAFSLCTALGLLATTVTWLGTRPLRWRVGIAAATAMLLSLVGSLDYEVRLDDLSDRYPGTLEQFARQLSVQGGMPASYTGIVDLQGFERRTLDFADGASAPAAALRDASHRERWLENWRRSFATASRPSPKPILVVVAVSGGALRAGVWAETVLGYLDAFLDDFSHHVRLITGASGGMLGAARFVVSQCDGHGLPGGPVGTRGALQGPPDYLSPIAWQIAFRDFLPNSLIPTALYNRGNALEEAWGRVDRGLDTTFEQLRDAEEQGLVPSIVFSPITTEDGRRLLIGNLPLADLTYTPARSLLVEDAGRLADDYRRDNARTPDDYDLEYPELASVSAVEFFRMFPTDRKRLRLAAAVRMSATFPYVTSSVVLPTFPPRHVVDAGYYDNYGVNLAGAWVASHARWLAENAAGVLFIQVRAFPNEARLKKLDREVLAAPPSEPGATPSMWGRIEAVLDAVPRSVGLIFGGLQSLVLPVEGLAHVRDSSMYFRNDAQLNGLHDTFRRLRENDPEFFRSVVFTCDTTPRDSNAPNVETLNWYMDPVEFARIRRNMEDLSEDGLTGRSRNHLRFESLLDWWRRRGGGVHASDHVRL
ncbi:hypothetical protein [Paludisphaera rhizosphaerae]|uniref:hypothetical protein n=1 Tax=Paludisphaera rhizosphaerae TaxID=2711216 RepID=UPI0013EE111F|nr:hypothetical protein [Paludisphaera rhizosphaerae]